MIYAAALFVFVAVTVLGTYWAFVVRPEEQAAGVVRRRLKRTPIVPRRVDAALLRQEEDLSAISLLDQVLRRSQRVVEPLRSLIDQAGVRLTPGALLLATAVLVLTGLAIGQFMVRITGVGLVLGGMLGAAPVLILRIVRTRRIHKFEEQFPEALDLLTRSLRAGHALTSGIELVAQEIPAPVGSEFQLLYDRQNFGMGFADALTDFAKRIPVLDAKFFATAVLIQRESGGDLSEILTNLSGVIRERFKVKRQVRALSAHGRITGWVLAGLPPALAMAVTAINPEHFVDMVGTAPGRQMIAVGLGLQFVGMSIIRRLLRPDY